MYIYWKVWFVVGFCDDDDLRYLGWWKNYWKCVYVNKWGCYWLYGIWFSSDICFVEVMFRLGYNFVFCVDIVYVLSLLYFIFWYGILILNGWILFGCFELLVCELKICEYVCWMSNKIVDVILFCMYELYI